MVKVHHIVAQLFAVLAHSVHGGRQNVASGMEAHIEEHLHPVEIRLSVLHIQRMYPFQRQLQSRLEVLRDQCIEILLLNGGLGTAAACNLAALGTDADPVYIHGVPIPGDNIRLPEALVERIQPLTHAADANPQRQAEIILNKLHCVPADGGNVGRNRRLIL